MSLKGIAEASFVDGDSQEIERLSQLSPMQYDRVRHVYADRLGVKVSTLDREIDALRKTPVKLQGDLVEFPEIDPWDDPVNGLEVFNDIAKCISHHMAMTEREVRSVVLWCAHTHCFASFSHSPRLVITAPARECGKTVLLNHIIGNLTPKSQSVDNLTPAVFFRLATSHKPTFLIDEVDSWLKEDSHLPAALNGGFESHGCVMRCEGDGHTVRKFSTFTPTAMAGIQLLKKLPSPTVSRAITIELQRALPGEISVPYNQRLHKEELHTLCRKLARWIADNRREICNKDPEIPALNRLADKWRPLFKIASIVGGCWPKYARRALIGEAGTDTQTKSEQLLLDIGAILKHFPGDRTIFTNSLIKELCNLDDSIWAEYDSRNHEDRVIKPRQLSNLLSLFNIKPGTVRAGANTGKGYRIGALSTVIERYAPQTAGTSSYLNNVSGSSRFSSDTSNTDVSENPTLQVNAINNSDDVTDSQCGSPNQQFDGNRYRLTL